MRGFRDHHKLTMVGFRSNRSHCLFDVYGTRSEVSGRVSIRLDPKCLSSLLRSGSRDTVSAGERQRMTRIQAFLRLDLKTGRCQDPRGNSFKRNKGFWCRGVVGDAVPLGFLGLWVSWFNKEGSRTVKNWESLREEVS